MRTHREDSVSRRWICHTTVSWYFDFALVWMTKMSLQNHQVVVVVHSALVTYPIEGGCWIFADSTGRDSFVWIRQQENYFRYYRVMMMAPNAHRFQRRVQSPICDHRRECHRCRRRRRHALVVVVFVVVFVVYQRLSTRLQYAASTSCRSWDRSKRRHPTAADGMIRISRRWLESEGQ